VGDAPGVTPRARPASLAPDPEFWVYLRDFAGGQTLRRLLHLAALVLAIYSMLLQLLS